MQLGVDGCFVGSGIFKSNCPQKRAHAMVQAVTHFNNPKVLAEISEDLGQPMVSFVTPLHFVSLHCLVLRYRWALTAMRSSKNGRLARASSTRSFLPEEI